MHVHACLHIQIRCHNKFVFLAIIVHKFILTILDIESGKGILFKERNMHNVDYLRNNNGKSAVEFGMSLRDW